MMRRFLYAISAGLLAALPVVSLVSSSVSAISPYDNVIQTTTDLTLVSSNGENSNDIQSNATLQPLLRDYFMSIGATAEFDSAWQSTFATIVVQRSLNANRSIYWIGNTDLVSSLSKDVLWEYSNNRYAARVSGNMWAHLTITNTNQINISGQIGAPSYVNVLGYDPIYPDTDLYLYQSTFNNNYPPDYEGVQIPNTPIAPSQNVICPAYQITVTAEGLLRVIYQTNISPFLTGTNHIIVNETHDEWQTLGTEVMNDSTTPAGWTDWTGDTLLTPNQHYLIRISHNQQLDSPPWTTQPTVQNVWAQILYNGSTPYTFTTSGCDSYITNPITKEDNTYVSIFEKLSLSNDEFGLGSVVTAPLTFIADLPSLASSCTPLTLPLPYVSSNISLPCMTPIYQSNFNAILTLYQSLLIGLFGYYAAVKIYGNIKQLKDPKDDQIEVIKL